jgi:GH15 family glucan-1,4-alpha-glucosidase
MPATDHSGVQAHGYLPIEEHGVIGDLRTVALVGTDGTIDWYCPGRFDAPSVFASILDKERGGAFRITPAHEAGGPGSSTSPTRTSSSPVSRPRRASRR